MAPNKVEDYIDVVYMWRHIDVIFTAHLLLSFALIVSSKYFFWKMPSCYILEREGVCLCAGLKIKDENDDEGEEF